MIERILEILKLKGMSPSQFADEIGVQRSAISHLVSGRNNPSLDFIMRVLKRFPEVSTDWLLNGTGKMMQGDEQQVRNTDQPIPQQPVMELFSEEPATEIPELPNPETSGSTEVKAEKRNQKRELIRDKRIEKIIFIYNDNTFRELKPE
jgi:transcriptional regulator with XRE-family HTH domain